MKQTLLKQLEGWDIGLIRKIKSRLSIKVFLLTSLLMVACCTVTYLFIKWFVPYSYKYDFLDVEHIAYELSLELPMVEMEEAPIWLNKSSEIIYENYDDEFKIHLFQDTGKEVSLHDLNSIFESNLDDYNKVTSTLRYQTSFINDTSQYTIFLTRNLNKISQVIEALDKVIPVLSVVIISISVIFAFFFTWYVTSPIKKVSKLSKKMVNMDFSNQSVSQRTDEIGVLSNSLNELSSKLNVSLSDLRKANIRLQSDIDTERQLERQRIEFFSAVSHELKTPITVIKGQLQGMLYGVGRYKDRETYLARSIEVTETLDKMVQELLTISRLETPGYVCNKASVDISKLLNERLIVHEDLFIQKDIIVEKELSLGIKFYGDMQLLQKAFDNLVSNALIYSPAGNKVLVNLKEVGDKIYLSFENTGIHIPDEVLPKLFEAFYRVDPSRNRQTGGTGLGLYIVKTIFDLHNAQIKIANSSQGVIVTIQF